MKIEIVPETVAEDECVRTGGFARWEEGAETGDFFGSDGEADHLLDCCNQKRKKQESKE